MEIIPVTEEHLKKLAEYGLRNISAGDCQGQRYASGEIILQEGMPVGGLLFVVGGKVKICRTAANGKSLFLCYEISNGMLGEIELMLDCPAATTTVMAITQFDCVFLNERKSREALRANAQLLRYVGTQLAEKLARSSDNYVAAALCSGEQRLCSYILQVSHRDMFSDTLTDAACSVGMSYRHLFRLLGQLCKEGILEKRSSGYRIIEREELERRAAVVN